MRRRSSWVNLKKRPPTLHGRKREGGRLQTVRGDELFESQLKFKVIIEEAARSKFSRDRRDGFPKI